jgi:protoporphyrinogen oxidase
VIIGGGPTGLAAGYRLRELGYTNFVLLEARHKVGGLASSETSPNGFIYDIGGHVLFSHYQYFDRLFDRLMGDEYQELLRESWVWMFDGSCRTRSRTTSSSCRRTLCWNACSG